MYVKGIKKNKILIFVLLFSFAFNISRAQLTLYKNYYIESVNYIEDDRFFYHYNVNIINPKFDSLVQSVSVEGTNVQGLRNQLVLDSSIREMAILIQLKNGASERIRLFFPYQPGVYLSSDDSVFMKPYMLNGDKLNIRADNSHIVEIRKFRENFEVARPPMASPKQGGNNTLSVDSSWTLPALGYFSFPEGTYYISVDMTTPGQPIRVMDNSGFPKYRKVEHLIGPMIYLTSAEEYKKMTLSEEPKKAFDRFWVNNISSLAIASSTIGSYYRNVTQANRIFSSFKEGWKTDQGMIYCVFGPPDRVFQLNDEVMEWEYRERYGLPSIRFRFYRVSTPLAPNYYQLIAKDSYERYWFEMIDLWREGKISSRVAMN